MNVLVTGGAGFIGSHIVDRLLEKGLRVTVLDNLITGRRSNVSPDAEFIEEDIRSDRIPAIWAEHHFEIMIHAAAQMDVRKSVMDPKYDADVNLTGLLNLMEVGRENGLKKVVFTSTGGAGYDDNVPFPTSEDIPARPVSPYGITKNTSELYLRFYHKEYGIDYVSLRLGNVYGPRQNPHGEAGVVAIFSRLNLAGETAIIFGDGLQTRDYVFCDDVAKAVIAALDCNLVDYFHVGTSRETNVVELHNLISRAAGSVEKPHHADAKSGEVRRSCLLAEKIEKMLGWKPTVTLEEGIPKTVEFFRRQMVDPDVR